MTLEEQNILSDEYKSFMYFLCAVISMSKWSQSLNTWSVHERSDNGLKANRDISTVPS